MSLGNKRTELSALADAKILDAQILLINARYSSAFYLAGYAVEFGLKACIAKQIRQETIPELQFIRDIHTHSFKKLVGLAGLNSQLQEEREASSEFATYWGIAGQWAPSARYNVTDAVLAQLMVQAVSEPKDGIMTWIRKYW